jgi:hypothetical protein
MPHPSIPRSPVFQSILSAAALILLAGGAGAQQEATLSPVAGGWEGEMRSNGAPRYLALTLMPGAPDSTSTVRCCGGRFAASEVRIFGDSVRMRIGGGPDATTITAELRDGRLAGHLVDGRDSLPFLLRHIPDYPPARGRQEGWAQDLEALSTRFLDLDHSFSPGERALFLERLADTRDHLAELSDDQVIVRMASAVALAHNAHTRLYLLRNRTELRRMPIRLWWFSDGLYVIRASPEHRDLLGCRIETIGGTAARLARDRVAPLFAGTPSWTDYLSVYSLTSPEALHGLGIIPSAETVTYGISHCPSTARSRITLRPLPLARSSDSYEAWWDLTPRHPGIDSTWAHVLGSGGRLPLYLQNPLRNYWFEYLPSQRVLYFQYNRSDNEAVETTAQFGERLLAALERDHPATFVLDVRFNTGGNLELAAGLMKQLQERTRGMTRFVITGRSTFSAGITAVASWRQAGSVTIVGEPVGDDLEFWAEGGNMRLPSSGFDAHFANQAHSYSPAPCPTPDRCYDLSSSSIDPDLPASASWSDYMLRRDPAMAAVLEQLRRR